MAVHVTGTGATVKSGTWEGVSIELAELLQGYEETANASLTNPINRVAVNYDSGIPKTANIQIDMPITLEIGTDGSPKVVADPFLPTAPSYTAGTGGDLKSTNLEAATLEAFYKLQALEKEPVALGGTAIASNVNIQINTETLIASVTATLPIGVAVNSSGKPEITAVAYL
jgi:hypothetical protein